VATVDPAELTRVLSITPFLAGASDATIASIASGARVRNYRRGEFLCRQDEPGPTVFVVVRGAVKLSAYSSEGDESVLATVHIGQSFGEFAALDGGTRSATAAALSDVHAAVIDGATLRACLATDAALLDALLRSLVGLARRATGQRLDLVFLDVASRLAKELVERADRHGASFHLEIGQTDLALLVGGSRQTANQVLRQLDAEGIISVRGRSVNVIDLEELRRRCGP
jgi:CRP-like cAMP-binding protein